MLIRSAKKSDLDQIYSLNESVLPHVNSIPISDFEDFMEISSFFLVIEEDNKVIGFIIVLGPGQKYNSENYKYFSNSYSSFDYVDRIVIERKYRGRGYGSKLYENLFESSLEKRITCEVNIKPPNPKSIKFHQMLGFREVKQQHSEGGKKFVSLMVKEI